MNFSEIFSKNLICDNIESHKKSGLHPLPRKYSFRKTTAGCQFDPLTQAFYGLKDFRYAESLAYYTLENKSNKTCEYQLDELDENLIENNYEDCSYPPKIELMISGETMKCRKVKRILQYHVPNKILSSGKISHHVLLLFYLLRDKKEYQIFHESIKINCERNDSRMLQA